eukprot:260157_1
MVLLHMLILLVMDILLIQVLIFFYKQQQYVVILMHLMLNQYHCPQLKVFPVSFLLDPEAMCNMSVNGTNVECHSKHPGAKAGQFRGKIRQELAAQQPRNTQLHLAGKYRFQRNTNNYKIPTHAVAKRARSENNHAYLHSDLYLSIRLYILKELQNPKYSHLDPIYRSPFHGTCCEPEFASSYFTEQTCRIAIKSGQFDEPPVSIDSSVKVVLDYVDPLTGNKTEMLCTPLICNSLANKEPILTFILFTPHRNYSIFNKHFAYFIDMCTSINNDKKPVFRLIRSDCAPFWQGMCLVLNGYNHKIYLLKCYIYLEENERLMVSFDAVNIK